MQFKRIVLVCGLVVVLLLAGCTDSGGGPTGPTNAPILTNVTVTPSPAHAGSIIIFAIDYTDISGDLNGGTAVITDNQGFRYNGGVSNAADTSGTLTTSVELSPLVRVGDLLFTIFVIDRAGNQSNLVYAAVTVI